MFSEAEKSVVTIMPLSPALRQYVCQLSLSFMWIPEISLPPSYPPETNLIEPSCLAEEFCQSVSIAKEENEISEISDIIDIIESSFFICIIHIFTVIQAISWNYKLE